MNSGTKRIEIPARCRVGVVSTGEFVVYGLRDGERVAVLGPSSVSDRTWRREYRRGEYSAIEVVAELDTKWTAELVKLSDGVERLDNTPVAVPVGSAPPTLSQQVRELVRLELSQHAAAQDFETFEEADDFDIDDEQDGFVSRYEFFDMDDEVFEPPPPRRGMLLSPLRALRLLRRQVRPVRPTPLLRPLDP